MPGRTIASAIRGGLRGDLHIGPRWSVFGFTDFERNALPGLELRKVLGGGAVYHLIKTNNLTVDHVPPESSGDFGAGTVPRVRSCPWGPANI